MSEVYGVGINNKDKDQGLGCIWESFRQSDLPTYHLKYMRLLCSRELRKDLQHHIMKQEAIRKMGKNQSDAVS